MGIKKYRPTTPSRRQMATPDFSEITKAKPERSLVVSLSQSAGRNNNGRVTMRHRGGRGRIKYRIVDFKRDKFGVPGKVTAIEYDPNRSARIALISYNQVWGGSFQTALRRRTCRNPASLCLWRSRLCGFPSTAPYQ